MKKIVSLNNVSFRYSPESEWAIKNITLKINEGEWVALVGHNGSGKSTLAKLLNGILMPEEGSILINETLVLNEENIWDIRKKVGMVFQNPDNQFVGTTVKDDVAFGLENIGIPRDEMIKRIEESVAQVKMLDYLDQEPHHLSGGQKQRVAIAGVLAIRPDLLILDESTAMLDPQGRKEVIQTVKKLNQDSSMTVISITHELDEVLMADRIIVMNEGEVYKDGTKESIFDQDEKLIDIGLDLPFPVLLSKTLIESGVPLTKYHLSQEELVEELWKLHSKM